MSIWLLTYQQSVFKYYRSDKHLSEFLRTRWRQKSTGIDMENDVTVTLCINRVAQHMLRDALVLFSFLEITVPQT